MKKLVLALSFVFSLSSAHAGKFDNVPWDEIVSNFAAAHHSPMEPQEKRQKVIRVFARNVYESVNELEYNGLGFGAKIRIPLDRYNDGKIILGFYDGEEFIAAMHKHFAAELAGFDVDKEGMYRYPGVFLAHLAPKPSEESAAAASSE